MISGHSYLRILPVAPMISKDEDFGWIAKIMIHWKDVNIPENINDRWNQISFTIWEILIKYNCHGCLFHEFYVKDFGIIEQERFRKIFQETERKVRNIRI